jgi:hypothetical protein
MLAMMKVRLKFRPHFPPSKNSYVKCYHKPTTEQIFKRLRNDGKYWDAFGPYKVCAYACLATYAAIRLAVGRVFGGRIRITQQDYI